MATNEILPFAGTDTGTNLLSQAAYNSDAERTTGNQPGIARSQLVNKALRQSSAIAAGVAQYIANRQAANMTDALTASQVAGYLADATDVYTPAGTGAVATTVQTKLREVEKSFSEYGITFDDSTDNSSALQVQFNKAAGISFAVPIGVAQFATGLTRTLDRFALVGKAPPMRQDGTDAGPCLKYTGTGTGLQFGVNPGGSGTFLQGIQVKDLRLKTAVGTTIGMRLYMTANTVVDNLAIFGSSGAGTGLKAEGCIDTEIKGLDVVGYNGAGGVIANYLAKGLWIQNGYLNSPTTTFRVRDAYLHYCLYGLYVGADTTAKFDGSIFEACTTGAQIDSNSHVSFDVCWFEACNSRAAYMASNTTSIYRSCRIDMYTEQTFFSASTPARIVLQDCELFSSHASPRLFASGMESQAGMKLIIDNTSLPANFTISGGGTDCRNVEVRTMRLVTYRFRKTGIAANATYNPVPQDSGSTALYVMPEKGHILSINSYYAGASITAGTYDFTALKNGGGVAAMNSGSLSASPGTKYSQYYLNKFVAGDTLGAYLHTGAAFAATGGEFIIEITVAFGEDGTP